jgi:catechol 2,3-dioxygenase-like lactoylglutathione lyase family enzyme
MTTMLEVRPALPVSDLARSVAFYQDKIGFLARHQDDGFAILVRDTVEIHLWLANDNSWRKRQGNEPIVSGAESFIAGTASCRIKVDDIDSLYKVIQPLGVIHGNSPITTQPWGDRDFGVLDPDGNLITFFQIFE